MKALCLTMQAGEAIGEKRKWPPLKNIGHIRLVFHVHVLVACVHFSANVKFL